MSKKSITERWRWWIAGVKEPYETLDMFLHEWKPSDEFSPITHFYILYRQSVYPGITVFTIPKFALLLAFRGYKVRYTRRGFIVGYEYDIDKYEKAKETCILRNSVPDEIL